MENIEEFTLTRKTAEKSTKSLKDALKIEGRDKILEEIVSMNGFLDTDLKAFDDFFSNKKLDTLAIKEKFMEAFIKISGIEAIIQAEIVKLNSRYYSNRENLDFSIENPLLFSCKKTHISPVSKTVHANTLFSASTVPFGTYNAYKIAKSIEKHDDSKICILASLICLDKEELYSGDYEVFYVLDYLLKDNTSNFILNNSVSPRELPAVLGNDNNLQSANKSNAEICDDETILTGFFPKEINQTVQNSLVGPQEKEQSTFTLQTDNNTSSYITNQIQENMLQQTPIITPTIIKNRKNAELKVFSSGEIQTIRGQVLVKWAKYCKKLCKSSVFPFETEYFFLKEVILLNDFDSLVEIIKVKKSHEILYLRFTFIFNFLNNMKYMENPRSNLINVGIPNVSKFQQLPDLSSTETCSFSANTNRNDHLFYLRWMKKSIVKFFSSSPNLSFKADLSSRQSVSSSNKFLASLIINSFDGYSPYTESILLDINSEYVITQLIYKTKTSIPAFYCVCRTIDPLYIECLNICIDRLDLMSDNQLEKVANSPLFKIYSFDGFKTIITRLCDNKIALPVTNLLKKVKIKNFKPEDNTLSWKIELIHRINFIIDHVEETNDILSIAKDAITRKDVNLSVGLLFKLKNFLLFKMSFNHLTAKHNELMVSIYNELYKRDFSVFYYRVTKFLIKNKHIVNLDFLDCSPYSQAMKSNLSKNKTIKSIIKTHQKSTISINITESENVKSMISNLQYDNNVVRGLYFFNSFLTIKNCFKKFILAVELVVYKETLEDMVLVKLGEHLMLCIEGGDINFKDRENVTKLLSLNEIIGQSLVKSEELDEYDYIAAEKNDNTDVTHDNIIRPDTLQKSTLIYALSNMSLSKFFTAPEKDSLTPVTIKFTIISTGKHIKIKVCDQDFINISVKNIATVSVTESFYGVLKSLFFAETTEITNVFKSGYDMTKKPSLLRNSLDFFNEYIKPIDKLLEYKRRKGVYIDKYGIFYLGKKEPKGFIDKKNIMEV